MKGVCDVRAHQQQNPMREICVLCVSCKKHIGCAICCRCQYIPNNIANAVCLPALNDMVQQYHAILCSEFLKSSVCTICAIQCDFGIFMNRLKTAPSHGNTVQV